ncbi:hypothetical protein KIPB_002618 [Kipferlia bialata]|nr:hypothetical protein KIPB_002618 [Kipferlia bialata]|eukprot:g2618.t1
MMGVVSVQETSAGVVSLFRGGAVRTAQAQTETLCDIGAKQTAFTVPSHQCSLVTTLGPLVTELGVEAAAYLTEGGLCYILMGTCALRAPGKSLVVDVMWGECRMAEGEGEGESVVYTLHTLAKGGVMYTHCIQALPREDDTSDYTWAFTSSVPSTHTPGSLSLVKCVRTGRVFPYIHTHSTESDPLAPPPLHTRPVLGGPSPIVSLPDPSPSPTDANPLSVGYTVASGGCAVLLSFGTTPVRQVELRLEGGRRVVSSASWVSGSAPPLSLGDRDSVLRGTLSLPFPCPRYPVISSMRIMDRTWLVIALHSGAVCVVGLQSLLSPDTPIPYLHMSLGTGGSLAAMQSPLISAVPCQSAVPAIVCVQVLANKANTYRRCPAVVSQPIPVPVSQILSADTPSHVTVHALSTPCPGSTYLAPAHSVSVAKPILEAALAVAEGVAASARECLSAIATTPEGEREAVVARAVTYIPFFCRLHYLSLSLPAEEREAEGSVYATYKALTASLYKCLMDCLSTHPNPSVSGPLTAPPAALTPTPWGAPSMCCVSHTPFCGVGSLCRTCQAEVAPGVARAVLSCASLKGVVEGEGVEAAVSLSLCRMGVLLCPVCGCMCPPADALYLLE